MRNEHERRLTLYAGSAQPCPYLGGRTSVLHYVDPQVSLDVGLADYLLALGFRRSGRYMYRPGCYQCKRCVSTRIPVDSFKPNRSQRRNAKLNSDIDIRVAPGRITGEHFALYELYLKSRHAGGGMDDPTPDSCEEFLLAEGCDTLMMELRLEERLVCVAVTDMQPRSLSAVYTFYDPDLGSRGLGNFAVYCQVAEARRLGLRYLYLGYWVAESEKMDYKRQYRPLELLENGVWRTYGRGDDLPVSA